eukprot:9883342-Ditylum_brightwellii.AAC.1
MEGKDRSSNDNSNSKPRKASLDFSCETRKADNTNQRRSSNETKSSIGFSVDSHEAVEDGKPGWFVDTTLCPIAAVPAKKKRRSESDIQRRRPSGDGDRLARSQSAKPRPSLIKT